MRELQNVIERAVIGSGGGPLRFDEDIRTPATKTETHVTHSTSVESLKLSDLERLEREIISRALEESKGRVYGNLGAAARLGLRPTTLAYRIKKLSVHKGTGQPTFAGIAAVMLR